MKAPDYLKLNPAGKVPTLLADGVVITETAAIVMYLADLFPQKKLAPLINEPKRAEYYKWMFILCNQFEPALSNKMFNIETTAEMHFALGYPELDVLIKQITEQLEHNEYLLGEEFSVVDMMLAALLAWTGLYKKIITLNPTLAAYLQKTMERPAYLHSQELNTAYLAQITD